MSDRNKQRSIQQHKRFFSVIAAAHHHWPESHPFKPENAEHLRAWLLVKAKHLTVKTFYMSDDASEIARLLPVIMASMLGKYSWAKAKGNELQVCVPMSIKFESVGHQEFQAINDAVDEIIRAETGLDPEQLLREKAA